MNKLNKEQLGNICGGDLMDHYCGYAWVGIGAALCHCGGLLGVGYTAASAALCYFRP